jgi:hypothetical protein
LSENADGFRASKIVHSVQNMVGDRDFSSSSLLGMRSKGVADDTFVAADLSLGQSASIVSAGSLPTATAPGGNVPNVSVTLGGGSL